VNARATPKPPPTPLDIAATDQFIDLGDPEKTPRIYTFQRYIALPQVHISTATQEQIANWDGTLNEAAPTTTTNANQVRQNAVGGAGGRGGRAGEAGRGKPAQGQQQSTRGAGVNPFMQALQGAAGSAPRSSGGSVPGGLGALFGGAR
jgi:hypothetical protein